MGSSMVDVKTDEANDRSTACLTYSSAGQTNTTEQRLRPNSSIRDLLLLIYKDVFYR